MDELGRVPEGGQQAIVLRCQGGKGVTVQVDSQGRTAAILTVENGSVLAGRLDRVEVLARDGVRMMTLSGR